MDVASDSFPEDSSLPSSASEFLSAISSVSSTHDIAPSTCHIRNFSKVVDALKSAANRATSTPGLSRYTSVHVMLLQWEFDDLGVGDEIQQLSEVLQMNYGFDVERWQIPSAKPIRKLTQTISNWVEKSDGEDNLFVLYYAGHGRIDDGRQVLWRNIRDSKHDQFAEIKWSSCEDVLHEAVSDTLFLLDCCYSAGSASRPLRGFSETIAASGFDSIAPPPGLHSFTTTLTRVLRRWASESTAFSVVKLHTEILVSLKEVPPHQISEGTSFEWRRTPVHYIRSSDLCPPSIVLSPLPGALSPIVETDLRNSEMGKAGEVPTLHPRVILSITLAEDLERDDGDACHRWLASFPLPTIAVTVEAVYRSFSTVILVSLPVAVWDHLPDIPGCSFVCFTSSNNLISQPRHDTAGLIASSESGPAGSPKCKGVDRTLSRRKNAVLPSPFVSYEATKGLASGRAEEGPSTTAADFTNMEAREVHNTSELPPEFDWSSGMYEAPEISMLWRTLLLFQAKAGKYVDFTNDLSRCTWGDVYKELRKADAAADGSSQRRWDPVGQSWETIGGTSSILAPGISALPKELYVLNGGLALIFCLARHSEMNRTKVLATFRNVPNTIEIARNRTGKRALDNSNSLIYQLCKTTHELQATLLRVLPLIFEKLVPGTFVDAWKSPFGGWKFDTLLYEVFQSTESVRTSTKMLNDGLLVGIDIRTAAMQSQLQEIIRLQRESQLSADASHGKTQLLHFLMEQLSFNAKCAITGGSQSTGDQSSWNNPGYSPDDLLRIIDVSHFQIRNDATVVIRRGSAISPADVERAAHMITAPQVKELLSVSASGPNAVVIDAHFDRAQLGVVSPLSYICAMLSQALRQNAQHNTTRSELDTMSPPPTEERPPHLVLEYFCALHLADDENLRGPQGLMRCLTCQLILSLVAHEWISSVDDVHLPHLRDSAEVELLTQLNVGAVGRLFTAMMRLVPPTVVIYCVVDGLSAFESEKLWRTDYNTVLHAFSDVAQAGIDFRLILTSPTACQWLDDFVLPAQRVSLRNFRASKGGGLGKMAWPPGQ